VVLGALRPHWVSLQLEMREGVMKGLFDSTGLGRQRQSACYPRFGRGRILKFWWRPQPTPDARVWAPFEQYFPRFARDHGEPALSQRNLFARLPAGEITLSILRSRYATAL